MHVVEIYLPTGDASLATEFEKLRDRLTEKFGGVTAFAQAPAQGAWRAPKTDQVEHDDVIVVEVMTDKVDRAWWSDLRTALELALQQKEILIRTHEVERL